MTNNQNRIYVVMGVSGSGKSAVAAAAARQLSAGFSTATSCIRATTS